MRKHAKLIGAVALGAAAVLTFVVVQTAGKPPAKVALAPIGAGDFDGAVSPNAVQVTCAPGATTGTADVQLKVTRSDLGATGGNLGPGGRVVVTWPGSDRATTINRFDRFYRAGPGSTFPCPPTEGQGVPTTFSFQLYKGSIAIGDAVLASADFFRFGSPS